MGFVMAYVAYIIHPNKQVDVRNLKRVPTPAEKQEMLGGPYNKIVGFTEYDGRVSGSAYSRVDAIEMGLPINPKATVAWRRQIPGHNLRGAVLIYFRK